MVVSSIEVLCVASSNNQNMECHKYQVALWPQQFRREDASGVIIWRIAKLQSNECKWRGCYNIMPRDRRRTRKAATGSAMNTVHVLWNNDTEKRRLLAGALRVSSCRVGTN